MKTVCRPVLEILEPRQLLSAFVPVPHHHPRHHPHHHHAIVAQPETVTGMSLSTATPAFGSTFTALLQGTLFPPVKTTNWYETIAYGGVTTAMTLMPGNGTSNTFAASEPGVYTIDCWTYYFSTNPSSPPPPPTHESATATVGSPDGVTVLSGIGTDVPINTNATINFKLTAASKTFGPFAAGFVEQNVQSTTGIDGVDFAGTTGQWVAAGYDGLSYANSYMSYGLDVTADASGWGALPPGILLISFEQQLRWTWTMLSASGQLVTFHDPLQSQYYRIQKSWDNPNDYQILD
jgi:hypothetical protein